MGKYPVTQEQWAAVARLPKVRLELDDSPSYCDGNTHPVECVSWNDAVEFCARLSLMMDHTYRLPSETQWEYACRAGTQTPFHFGPVIAWEVATYRTDSTTDVGSFPPNAFGLYDMHGNVWEWCQDSYHATYDGGPTNGQAWLNENSQLHIVRGGSWDLSPRSCRSACRYYFNREARSLNLGFRVMCETPRGS